MHRLLQQAHDPGHRDPHPVGAVVELVAQLVHRLLELEDGQQRARVAPRPGQQAGSTAPKYPRGTPRACAPPSPRGRRCRAAARPPRRRTRTTAASRRRRAAASACAGARAAGAPARPRSRARSSASGASSVWPRCRSPWWRMSLPPAPMCESSAGGRAPPRRGRDRRERLGPRGGRRSIRSICSSIVAVMQRRATPARAPRARTRVARRPSRARCASRRRPRRGPRMRPRNALRVGRRARRARAPSRRGRRRRSAGATPSVASISSPVVVIPARRARRCSGSRAR